jgi:hypothetical protein
LPKPSSTVAGTAQTGSQPAAAKPGTITAKPAASKPQAPPASQTNQASPPGGR